MWSSNCIYPSWITAGHVEAFNWIVPVIGLVCILCRFSPQEMFKNKWWKSRMSYLTQTSPGRRGWTMWAGLCVCCCLSGVILYFYITCTACTVYPSGVRMSGLCPCLSASHSLFLPLSFSPSPPLSFSNILTLFFILVIFWNFTCLRSLSYDCSFSPPSPLHPSNLPLSYLTPFCLPAQISWQLASFYGNSQRNQSGGMSAQCGLTDAEAANKWLEKGADFLQAKPKVLWELTEPWCSTAFLIAG